MPLAAPVLERRRLEIVSPGHYLDAPGLQDHARLPKIHGLPRRKDRRRTGRTGTGGASGTQAKDETIRLWKHRRMRVGQRSYIPGVGRIRLTAVEEVDLEQLSDADARADGFETTELRAEIARLYPERGDGGI